MVACICAQTERSSPQNRADANRSQIKRRRMSRRRPVAEAQAFCLETGNELRVQLRSALRRHLADTVWSRRMERRERRDDYRAIVFLVFASRNPERLGQVRSRPLGVRGPLPN